MFKSLLYRQFKSEGYRIHNNVIFTPSSFGNHIDDGFTLNFAVEQNRYLKLYIKPKKIKGIGYYVPETINKTTEPHKNHSRKKTTYYTGTSYSDFQDIYFFYSVNVFDGAVSGIAKLPNNIFKDPSNV